MTDRKVPHRFLSHQITYQLEASYGGVASEQHSSWTEMYYINTEEPHIVHKQPLLLPTLISGLT